MPHNRFFSKDPISATGIHEIHPDELSHLKVLRPVPGDALELMDGLGTLGNGTIHSLEKNRAFVTLDSIKKEAPPIYQRQIALAILRPSHLDFAVEKMTEVGIDGILLFPGALSEKKELSTQAQIRLSNILKAACKQSGRLFVPKLSIFPSLDQLLKSVSNTTIYFGDHLATQKFQPCEGNTLFVIGAESGLSKEEKKLIQSYSGTPTLLSKNTLRAETAAIIAAYVVLN